MLPYTVIKEANRPEHSGTATGVINFINFSLSAVLGPVFGSLLMRVSGGGERELAHYQAAFQPLVFGVAAAIVLTLFLRETGPARVRRAFTSAALSAPIGQRETVTRWQARQRESQKTHDGTEPWFGFTPGLWTKEIDVRDFIQQNVTPYDGDGAFLAGPTERTKAIWAKLRPCSSRSARRASSTSRRFRARSPRTMPATSTRRTRSSSVCRPKRR